MRIIVWSIFFSLISFGKTHYSQNAELSTGPKGELYALLVTGSHGWWNYRHQADISHAYQLLKSKGVPSENIVVMMYDDVASDSRNPFPGKLFNQPNGDDVYAGLIVDYMNDSVTSANFLNVLQGNSQNITGGTGRVISSGSDDRIFVYVADNGGVGLLGFPNDLLTKYALNNALQQMYYNKRYDQIVFYLDSSESGSMFEGALWKTMNVYAMTATNPHEQSYAAYCNNKKGLPCLGDLFSVNWMRDSEKHDISLETLLTQYKDVKRLTNESHVMRYGNLELICEPVSWFEGKDEEPTPAPTPYSRRDCYNEEPYPGLSWPARDSELKHLQKLRKTSNSLLVSQALEQRIAKIYEKQMMEERNAVKNLKCHNDVVKAFDSICIDVNKFDYAMKYIYVLNNLCVKIGDSKQIIDAMRTTCSTIGKKYL